MESDNVTQIDVTNAPAEGTGADGTDATSTPTQLPPPDISVDGSPAITPSPTCTPMPTSTPLPSVTILFGGSNSDVRQVGPDPASQTPVWYEIADVSYQYPASKVAHAQDALGDLPNYENKNLLVVGYSAGADSALLFADGYRKHQENNNLPGKITGLAILGGTMTDDGNTLQNNGWVPILNGLLVWGTDIYVLDDAAFYGDEAENYGTQIPIPPNASGTFYFETDPIRRSQEHWQGGAIGTGTNNSPEFRDYVLNWFNNN